MSHAAHPCWLALAFVASVAACVGPSPINSDSSSDSTATDGSECVAGELGCACDGNSCADGLECLGGLCAALECWPGELGCECNEGHCLAGLHCVLWECVDLGCIAGELDCACNANECLPGLECISGFCVPDDDPGDGDGDEEPVGPLDCEPLDPTQMYLFGTYIEGHAYNALAQPAAPRVSCPGFDHWARDGIIRPTDGRMIFVRQGNNDGLHIFEPDPLIWQSGEWSYPAAPYDNDGLIPTPGCQTLAPEFAIHPIDGAVVYSCDGQLFREGGEPIGDFLEAIPLAVLTDGDIVVCWEECLTVSLARLHEDGTTTPIEIPGTGAEAIVNTRHGPAGLWLAVSSEDGEARWRLDGDVAIDEGVFTAPIGMTWEEWAPVAARLAADGSLWQRVYFGQLEDALIRRPLAGSGETELMYEEATGPVDNFDETVWPFVFMHSSFVLSGP